MISFRCKFNTRLNFNRKKICVRCMVQLIGIFGSLWFRKSPDLPFPQTKINTNPSPKLKCWVMDQRKVEIFPVHSLFRNLSSSVMFCFNHLEFGQNCVKINRSYEKQTNRFTCKLGNLATEIDPNDSTLYVICSPLADCRSVHCNDHFYHTSPPGKQGEI